MKRIASIWLAHWRTDRLKRLARPDPARQPGGRPDGQQEDKRGTGRSARRAPSGPARALVRPLVLVQTLQGAQRLSAVDAAGARAGLRPGQTLAEARAMAPGLIVERADPQADREALERLALWAGRWSPVSAVDDSAGDGCGGALVLDVTGCAHLFGGEAALAGDMTRRLRALGYECAAAIASSWGAAWALARFEPEAALGLACPPGQERARLPALPVEALRVDEGLAAGLRKLGLKTLGDVEAMPRAALARRFPETLLHRLDQAMGRRDEPVTPARPEQRFTARAGLVEPLLEHHAILDAAGRLIETVCRGLEREGAGARVLCATLYRVDGALARLRCEAARPMRAPAAFAQLLKERLEASEGALDLGFGVDAIEIAACETARLDGLPGNLALAAGEGGEADKDRLERTLARLSARLGRERVLRPGLYPAHHPERAALWRPALNVGEPAPRPVDFSPSAPPANDALAPPRSVVLFFEPEPVEAVAEAPDGPPRLFTWRGTRHRVARACGPERIAPDWRTPETAAQPSRDYFQIETEEGRRFWLMRAGLYERETASPRWFVHGAG